MTYFSKAMFYRVNSDSRFDLLVNILLKIEENLGLLKKRYRRQRVKCFALMRKSTKYAINEVASNPAREKQWRL